MIKLPWQPLFTIERSGRPEVTRSGIIAVVDGQDKVLLATGDIDFELWSRSCLKPLQLLDHLDVIKANYPNLQSHHLALMMSSHSGENIHVKGVREILAEGKVEEGCLQCPPSYPMPAEDHYKLKFAGEPPKSIYHNCSGKHSGYLLAMKAQGMELSNYLNKNGKQFEPLQQIMAWLLKKPDTNFDATTDGCRLPNYLLTPRQMATLYLSLLKDAPAGAPPHLASKISQWHEIKTLMCKHPNYIGGTGRIDTRLMRGEFHDDKSLAVLAKQGADGLLAISVAPTGKHPTGLGILIKVDSGFAEKHHQIIVERLFALLGLKKPTSDVDESDKHLQNQYHFSILEHQKV